MTLPRGPDLFCPIASVRFTAIDFESTGASSGLDDQPIQIGIATLERWQAVPGDLFVSHLATDRHVTADATRVHGIGKQDLLGAPRFLDLWPEVSGRLSGAAVVAHGAGTERRFLRVFPGHRFGPWVDTLRIARLAFPEASSHSLGDLCRMLDLETRIEGIVPDRTWHDALFDAVASLLLLQRIIAAAGLQERSLQAVVV